MSSTMVAAWTAAAREELEFLPDLFSAMAAPELVESALLVDRLAAHVESLRLAVVAEIADRDAEARRSDVRCARAEFVDDVGWSRDEYAAAAGMTRGQVCRRADVALRLRDLLPATRAALADGRITLRHAEALADAIGPLLDSPEACRSVEKTVLTDRRCRTSGQFGRRAEKLAAALAPAVAELQAADVRGLRSCAAWQTAGGLGKLHAVLPMEDLERVVGAIGAAAEPTGPEDERTAEQRRADALVDLLTGEGSGCPVPDGAGGDRIVVTLPHTALPPTLVAALGLPADDRPAAAPRARTAVAGATHAGFTTSSVDAPGDVATIGNRLLDAASLDRIACGAAWQRAILDTATGAVRDLGRAHRFPDSRLRRAIGVRDGETCTFPGCPVDRNLHAHHLRPWDELGPTDQDLLTLLCRRHHRLIHHTSWTASRGSDGVLVWIDPRGRRYDIPPATWRPPPDPPRTPPLLQRLPFAPTWSAPERQRAPELVGALRDAGGEPPF